jgi:hypothetical protein
MTNPSLGERLTRRADELRQLRLEAPIRRIEALPAPEPTNLAELSVNPRLRHVVLSDEAALWPLQVLALPQVPKFERLEPLTIEILERINEGAKDAPSGLRKTAAQTARDRLQVAYLFLRWPQNRELTEQALMRASNERPSPDSIPLPSAKELFFRCLGKLFNG